MGAAILGRLVTTRWAWAARGPAMVVLLANVLLANVLLAAALVVAVQLAVTAAATAQTPPAAGRAESIEKAHTIARTAKVFADEGRVDEAIGLYLEAYALDPAPALLYNLGRLYERKGDLARARAQYERVIEGESRPGGGGADSRLSRMARARLDSILDRVPGTLVVTSSPAGASIKVDGRPVSAGAGIPLKRGSHEVEVTLKGHAPERRTAEVLPGGETRLSVELGPLPGFLAVRCDRAGARVTVDGRDERVTPIERPYVLDPGRHVVEVVAKGYEREVRTAVVGPDSTASVDVTLRPVAVAAPAPPVVRAEAAPAPASKRFTPWQWVAIGTGAALVATGGVLTFLAGQDRAAVDSAATFEDGTVQQSAMTRSAALDRYASANRKTDGSIACYAVGGAVLATGVALAIVEAVRHRPGGTASATVSPMPVPGGGAAIGLAGRF